MDVNQREQQTVSYFLDKWNFKQWFLLMLSVNVDGCVVSVHVHCINCICCRCRIMLYYNFLCWFTCITVVAWCCFNFIMPACLLHRRDIHHKKNASRVYINVTTTVVKEFEKKNVDKNMIHFSVIMTKRILLQLLCLSCFRDAHTLNAHHGVGQKAQFMTTSIFHW